MGKIAVGILGATGAIGECYRALLQDHPHFEVKFLAASEKNIGHVLDGMPLHSIEDQAKAKALGVKILFSGLITAIAKDVEPVWGEDFLVISSSSAFRQKGRTILPEINGQIVQGVDRGVFAKTNCTLHGILLPTYFLKELHPKRVIATTLQAVSGAGKKGIGGMEIIDNVIPYIADEEKKVGEEFHFFLKNVPLNITCCRVPVIDGHTVSLTIDFEKEISLETVKQQLKKSRLFHLFEEQDRPQPHLDRLQGKGMQISIGRIRCSGKTIEMVTLIHNRIRGSAGTGIKIAEIAYGLAQPGF